MYYVFISTSPQHKEALGPGTTDAASAVEAAIDYLTVLSLGAPTEELLHQVHSAIADLSGTNPKLSYKFEDYFTLSIEFMEEYTDK